MHESIKRQTNAQNRFGWTQTQFFIFELVVRLFLLLLHFYFLNKFTEHQFCSIKCDSNHCSGTVRSTLAMLLLLFLFCINFLIKACALFLSSDYVQYLALIKKNEKSICLVHVVLCLSKINNRFCASYKLCFAHFIVVMMVYCSVEHCLSIHLDSSSIERSDAAFSTFI